MKPLPTTDMLVIYVGNSNNYCTRQNLLFTFNSFGKILSLISIVASKGNLQELEKGQGGMLPRLVAWAAIPLVKPSNESLHLFKTHRALFVTNPAILEP